MQGISTVFRKRVQVGVGRGLCSILYSNPQEETPRYHSDQGPAPIMSDSRHNWNEAWAGPLHKNSAFKPSIQTKRSRIASSASPGGMAVHASPATTGIAFVNVPVLTSSPAASGGLTGSFASNSMR